MRRRHHDHIQGRDGIGSTASGSDYARLSQLFLHSGNLNALRLLQFRDFACPIYVKVINKKTRLRIYAVRPSRCVEQRNQLFFVKRQFRRMEAFFIRSSQRAAILIKRDCPDTNSPVKIVLMKNVANRAARTAGHLRRILTPRMRFRRHGRLLMDGRWRSRQRKPSGCRPYCPCQ